MHIAEMTKMEQTEEEEEENHFYGFHFVVIIIVFAIIVTSNKIRIYSLNVLRVLMENVKKIAETRAEKNPSTKYESGIKFLALNAENFPFCFHRARFFASIESRQFFDYDKLKNYWAEMVHGVQKECELARGRREECQLDL